MQKAHQLEEQVRSNVRENCDNIQNVMIYLEDASAMKKEKNQDEHLHHNHDGHEHDHHH